MDTRMLFLGLVFLFAVWLIVRLLRTQRFSLKNKVVLITGGSRGLGLVLARQICAEGGRVVLLARDLDELARAKDDLAVRGGEAFTIQCDLLESAQIQSAVRQPLEHMTREDFERAMKLHFWAPFELIMQIIPEMRRRGGGRIVNISSIGGKIAVPHMTPYAASKFALVGLSDALRAELARDSIHITTVTPGLMRTGSEGHAKFKGDHAAEYKSFTGASKLPFASISAERAARKILAACRRGQPALIMPLPARALIIANAFFPNLTARIFKIVNKRLPPPVGASGNDARAGSDVR